MIELVLQSHLSRYPDMQVQDLYKLLHQAAFGSEHAMADPGSTRNRLVCEITEMGNGPAEPLVDRISPEGEIVRVHLRPFVTSRHDPELLLEAFLLTANEYHGEAGLLEQYWQVATATTGFSAAQMDEFIRSLKAQSFPAVHHSQEYEKMYCPAYRVVASAFCPPTWF